ncbi:hypothetical protein CsSME_00027319 [Camellia sinensis var. sinensis]
MGYVLRVRMASFFAGAAAASFVGMYILYQDYQIAHHSISQQLEDEMLIPTISALFKPHSEQRAEPLRAAS